MKFGTLIAAAFAMPGKSTGKAPGAKKDAAPGVPGLEAAFAPG